MTDRERAAGLLHDKIGGALTGVGVQLELLRMDVEAGQPEMAARIREIQRSLDEALEEVRALSRLLRDGVQ